MKTIADTFTSADDIEFRFELTLDARSDGAFAVLGGWIEGSDKVRTPVQARTCIWPNLGADGLPHLGNLRNGLIAWVEAGEI